MIGIANSSHCEEHIHLSFKKVGASYVDPTRFLEKAYPTLPAWVQQCDDYKLVFKVRERERERVRVRERTMLIKGDSYCFFKSCCFLLLLRER